MSSKDFNGLDFLNVGDITLNGPGISIGEGSYSALTDTASSIAIGGNANATGSSGGIAIGYGAESGSGANNVSIGKNAGDDLSTGTGNVSIGYGSGMQAGSGKYCVAVGTSHFFLTSKDYAVAIGKTVGAASNVGVYSDFIAIGHSALAADEGISIGHLAASASHTGSGNISIGKSTAMEIGTGVYNICLGAYSNMKSSTTDRTTALGYQVHGETNGVVIGSNSFSGSEFSVSHSGAGPSTNISTVVVRSGLQTGLYRVDFSSATDFEVFYDPLGTNVSKGTGTTGTRFSNELSFLITASGSFDATTQFDITVTQTSSPSSVVIGDQASAGQESISIGYLANTQGTSYAIAIGTYAQVLNNDGIAIGRNALVPAGALNGISIGGGSDIGTGDHCISIGGGSGNPSASGAYNIIIGNNAGNNMGSGRANVLIGRQAGDTITTGIYNTCIGHIADVTSGVHEDCVVIGRSSRTGNKGTACGSYAYAGGTESVAVGRIAYARANRSIAIGYQASHGTGTYCISIGSGAGATSGTGTNNICIGTDTGTALTTGTRNVIIGETANIISGGQYWGVAVGHDALTSTRGVALGAQSDAGSGSGGVSIGFSSDAVSNYGVAVGWNTTGAFHGVAVGVDAFCQNSYAVAVGKSTDAAAHAIAIGNTAYAEGGSSIAIGRGSDTGSGSEGISIGRNAGNVNATGARNICIGYGAGNVLVAGLDNVFIGTNAEPHVSSVQDCVCIGDSSSCSSFGVAIGSGANSANGTVGIAIGVNAYAEGLRSIAIGDSPDTGSGSYGVTIGFGSGNVAASGANNVLIGKAVGTTISSGSENTIVGTNAGTTLTTGTNNVLIGYNAETNGTGTGRSVAVGRAAITSQYSVVVGPDSGNGSMSGSSNVIIGRSIGTTVTSGGANVIVGSNSAGSNVTSGGGNVCIGSGANCLASGDTNVVAIGVSAVADALGVAIGSGADAGAVDCVAIGTSANCGTTAATSGVVIGDQAGNSSMSGVFNVMVGFQAGSSTTTGNRNVCIGRTARATTSASQNVVIGYSSYNTVFRGVCIGALNAVTASYGIAIGNNATANQAGFFVNPVRVSGTPAIARYDSATDEFFTTSSTIRYKENIIDAEDLTGMIDDINVKRFRWKILPNLGCAGKESIGMIAEEMFPLLPEVVPLDQEGLPVSINYDMLTMILWQEAQKQRARVKELEDRIEALELAS